MHELGDIRKETAVDALQNIAHPPAALFHCQAERIVDMSLAIAHAGDKLTLCLKLSRDRGKIIGIHFFSSVPCPGPFSEAVHCTERIPDDTPLLYHAKKTLSI